jgi:thiol-disulfide isomerase/thioredoxin
MYVAYRLFIVLTVSILIPFKVFSQGLTIGQPVPNTTFSNVLNYTDSILRMQEVKGKLIIFDFWSFWCAPCLSNFKKIDSLQNKYRDRIQIILVNRDTKEETIEFLKKRPKLKIPSNIPLITSDTLLNQQFAHVGVPFYAWVNEQGKLIYLTHELLTSEKVERHLRGEVNLFKSPSRTEYADNIFKYGILENIKYGTLIFKGSDTLSLYIDHKGENIQYYPRPIMELYQFAYNESDSDGKYKFREPGRTVLEVKNPSNYKYPGPGVNMDEWRSKYGYYYYAILPEKLQAEKYKIMQEELRRYFSLNVSIEKREVKCLKLVRTSKRDLLKTKGGQSLFTNLTVDLKDEDNVPNAKRRFQNVPFNTLFTSIKAIGNWLWDIKIVDSTGYEGHIDFEASVSDLEYMTIDNFRKVIRKYDLDLIPSIEIMEVLVLRE